MKTHRILKRMSKALRKASDLYENGEATIGRRVDEHGEILVALMDAVSELCGVVSILEVREKALRAALRAPNGDTD